MRRHRSLFPLLTLLSLGACTSSAEGPDPDLEPQADAPRAAINLSSRQLTVMTWNVAFMEFDVQWAIPVPGGLNFRPQTGYSDLEYEERAVKIAESILRADADVVVLNEVFSDDIRDILVDMLRTEYPNFVAKLESDVVPEGYIGPLAWIEDILPEGVTSYTLPPIGSGLMIFSRVPFAELDKGMNELCSDVDCAMWGENDGHELKEKEVGFLRFDACTGLDCMASKGVGVVKLDTPAMPTYVAFAHLQADGGHDDEREKQLGTVSTLLHEVASKQDLESSPVYFLGDLNIEGDSSEWADRFDPAGVSGDGFFACGNDRPCNHDTGRVLTDAWGFETSPKDPGNSGQGGNRLDYIFHNHLEERLCMQHVMLPYFALEDGESWYSDHRAVMGEFAAAADWCSPNLAHPDANLRPNVLQFGAFDCDNGDNDPTNDCMQDVVMGPAQGAKITNPGNVQWFVIDEPGSYSMDVQSLSSNASVDFDVYHESDLSRPLKPFNEGEKHPEFGWSFPMHDGTYYIRVYPTKDGKRDREVANVDYELRVHQHLCREPLDACPVYPGMKIPQPWPDSTQTTTPVDELYYRFKTSTVGEGRLLPPEQGGANFPDVDFFLETSFADAECFDEPTIYEYDDVNLPMNIVRVFPFDGVTHDTDDDYDDNAEYDERWQGPQIPGKKVDDLTEYFVRIPRDCANAMGSSVRYETTLTYLWPGNLMCDEQADDSGVGEDDHIRIDFTFDQPNGPFPYSPPCENNCDYYGVFDEAWPPDLQQPGQDELGPDPDLHGWYVDRFYPNMFESEGDANDPDMRLWVQFMSPGGWDPQGLPPLSAARAEKEARFVFGDDDDCDIHKQQIGNDSCNPDYWYVMRFFQNHRGDEYK